MGEQKETEGNRGGKKERREGGRRRKNRKDKTETRSLLNYV